MVSITTSHVCLMLHVLTPVAFIYFSKNSSKKLTRRCSKRNTRLWENRKRRFSWRLDRKRTNAREKERKCGCVLEGNYGLVVAAPADHIDQHRSAIERKNVSGQIFKYFNSVASRNRRMRIKSSFPNNVIFCVYQFFNQFSLFVRRI